MEYIVFVIQVIAYVIVALILLVLSIVGFCLSWAVWINLFLLLGALAFVGVTIYILCKEANKLYIIDKFSGIGHAYLASFFLCRIILIE